MHNNKSQKSKVSPRFGEAGKSQKFLEKIVQLKKEDLVKEKKNRNYSSNTFSVRSKNLNSSRFVRTIAEAAKQKRIALIAEVKFASPTSPNLGPAEDLLKRVTEYEKAGADAISIITEKHFFKGSLDFVTQVKKIVKIPVLQKDFVIDEYQIYQAKEIGSDAILLIARLVDAEALKQFVDLALKIGVEPVVEINDDKDLMKAITTKTNIIAVNARDLDTFEVSVEKACNLLKRIPENYIKLGFSGIKSKEEVDKYIKSGANGVLVGTALMKTDNVYNFILSLRGEDTSDGFARNANGSLNDSQEAK